MTNLITGIQSSGRVHLGNVLGCINPSIKFISDNATKIDKSFVFIADLHSLTSIKNALLVKNSSINIISAWLALGLDNQKTIIFRQSKSAAVCELMWYLSCVTPYPMLANSHAFKEKSGNLYNINVGLFTYPILMTADILIYESSYVVIGRDQRQHLEITRDIAKKFNSSYETNVFTLPEALIYESQIYGTDGRKMSKTYQNTIDIFASDDLLKKQIMSIKTDSLGLHEKKNYNKCNIFAIYKSIATENEIEILKDKYSSYNYGYVEAKTELYKCILSKFGCARDRYNKIIRNHEYIEAIFTSGENAAKNLANDKLDQVRNIIGYKKL